MPTHRIPPSMADSFRAEGEVVIDKSIDGPVCDCGHRSESALEHRRHILEEHGELDWGE